MEAGKNMSISIATMGKFTRPPGEVVQIVMEVPMKLEIGDLNLNVLMFNNNLALEVDKNELIVNMEIGD